MVVAWAEKRRVAQVGVEGWMMADDDGEIPIARKHFTGA
jgi:hypothetical protein